MCGIVGIAGSLFSREEMTMKRLLLLDSLRGMDSTGFAAVKNGGMKTEIAKRATHCFNLFDTKTFSDALNCNTSLAFIGHNRSATVGGIKDVNAHPFQIGHITGVHNGTLADSDKGMLEDIVGEKFNTDSEALFAAIAKIGVKEVIPKLTSGKDHFKGAWSLVWWNATDRTLNFLRNSHRPMWYCFSDDFKLVFWASEFWMLDAALQKAGTYTLYKKQSEKSPGKEFRFFQTEADVHYIVDVEKLAKGGKDRPKFVVNKLAGKEPVEAATSYPFREPGNSKTHGNECGKNTILQMPRKTEKSSSSGEPGAITLLGDIDNPYAGYFNETGFSFLGNQQRSNCGHPTCSWCHGEVPYGQPGITVYTRDNILMCLKCSGGDPLTVTKTSDFAPPNRVYVPRTAFNELK